MRREVLSREMGRRVVAGVPLRALRELVPEFLLLLKYRNVPRPRRQFLRLAQ